MTAGTIVVPIAPHHRPYWQLHCAGFAAAVAAVTASRLDGVGPAGWLYAARRHLAHPVWANWALAALGLVLPLALPLDRVALRPRLPLALPERPDYALDGLDWPTGPGPWRFRWDETRLWLDGPSTGAPTGESASHSSVEAGIAGESPVAASEPKTGSPVGWAAGLAVMLAAPAVMAREVLYEPRRGETLRQVADSLWGNADAWRSIWQLNRDRVRNPGFLESGITLRLPDRPGPPGPLPANPIAVRPGDTLWDLAGRLYGDSWAWPLLWGWNRTLVRDPHWIFPDQRLHWQVHGTLHSVRPGETLWSIARDRLGKPTAWPRLWQANRGWLQRPSALPVGSRLWVPEGTRG